MRSIAGVIVLLLLSTVIVGILVMRRDALPPRLVKVDRSFRFKPTRQPAAKRALRRLPTDSAEIESTIREGIAAFEKLDVDLMHPCTKTAADRRLYGEATLKMNEVGTLIQDHSLRAKYRQFYESRFSPRIIRKCD